MRIGIDGACWQNRRGFGRYARSLLTAMFAQRRGHEFVVFLDHEPEPELFREGVSVVRVNTDAAVTEAAVAGARRSISDLLRFRRAVMGAVLDVMFFPAVYSWYPTGGRAPTVITFHDAIAERYPHLIFPDLKGRFFWSAKLWLAIQTARQFTTVSNAARDEIVEHLRIPRDRISVMLEAADPHFRPITDLDVRRAVRGQLGLAPEARLLLYVGGFAPHKNLLRLVDAFAMAQASPQLADVHLVFVGDPKGDGFYSHTGEIKARIASHHSLAGRVHFTGYVSDDDLCALYSDALALAMPALSEGFGLPAAEAIACGTPVIATRGGAVAEVVADAGLFFDPLDTREMASVIAAVAQGDETLAKLRAACLPRAAKLSWSHCASQMLDLLESCGKSR
jgi:glycosyltransferase involved in cell wall biosynthesis